MICYDAIVTASHVELLASVRPHDRPRGARDLIIAGGPGRYPKAAGRFRLTLRDQPLARSDAAGTAMPITAPKNPRPSRVILRTGACSPSVLPGSMRCLPAMVPQLVALPKAYTSPSELVNE